MCRTFRAASQPAHPSRKSKRKFVTIRFHIEGLKEDGLPVPAPSSIAEYVEA